MLKILENVSLAQHSTYHVGGAAQYAASVNSLDDLRAAVAFAEEKKIPWRVLGGGSNVLVSDNGYPGLIIWWADKQLKIDEATGVVAVGAGALTAVVAGEVTRAGLTGFEWAAGVPGTIGGAVYGNAGAAGGEMKNAVVEVQYFENNSVRSLKNFDCEFAYRHSGFKNRSGVILSVILNLEPADPAECQKKLLAALQYRAATQPKGLSSCGCVFKNIIQGTEKISAGKLIDEAGLKGARVGDAEISTVHGNFIVNRGRATAADILALIGLVKKTVATKNKISLTEEITIL